MSERLHLPPQSALPLLRSAYWKRLATSREVDAEAVPGGPTLFLTHVTAEKGRETEPLPSMRTSMNEDADLHPDLLSAACNGVGNAVPEA